MIFYWMVITIANLFFGNIFFILFSITMYTEDVFSRCLLNACCCTLSFFVNILSQYWQWNLCWLWFGFRDLLTSTVLLYLYYIFQFSLQQLCFLQGYFNIKFCYGSYLLAPNWHSKMHPQEDIYISGHPIKAGGQQDWVKCNYQYNGNSAHWGLYEVMLYYSSVKSVQKCHFSGN